MRNTWVWLKKEIYLSSSFNDDPLYYVYLFYHFTEKFENLTMEQFLIENPFLHNDKELIKY